MSNGTMPSIEPSIGIHCHYTFWSVLTIKNRQKLWKSYKVIEMLKTDLQKPTRLFYDYKHNASHLYSLHYFPKEPSTKQHFWCRFYGSLEHRWTILIKQQSVSFLEFTYCWHANNAQTKQYTVSSSVNHTLCCQQKKTTNTCMKFNIFTLKKVRVYLSCLILEGKKVISYKCHFG